MSSNTISGKIKKLLRCSSICRRPKLSSIFSPKPKPPKYHQTHFNQPYYNCRPTPTTTATFSDHDCYNNYQTTPTTASSSPSMAADETGKAVAVEQYSSDPYVDFKKSMADIIFKYAIFSKDDLRHLLTCFLQLNSPCLHGDIIRAFTEIWNKLFCPASSSAAASSGAQGRDKNYSGRRGGRKDVDVLPPKAYVRP